MSRTRTVFVELLCGLAVALAGCASPDTDKIVFLECSDFGPQALAYQLIGFEWYQWDSQGYEDPNYRYNIRIVVYDDPRGLDRIKTQYPTVNGKTDYRYVARSEAIAHLKRDIADCEKELKEDPQSGLDGVLKTLKATLDRLDDAPSRAKSTSGQL
jgi:hypothetical protein